jgi:hypothetical protein
MHNNAYYRYMWPVGYTQEYEDWFSVQKIEKYPEILEEKDA